MDFKLNQTQQLTKNMVGEFAQKNIVPVAEKLDHESIFPKDILDKLAQLRLLGLLIPQKYGGTEVDTITYSIVIEEISKVCASLGIIIDVHSTLGTYPILQFGTEEQREKYVAPLAAGQKLGAFAVTEPNAGSDISSLETTAKLEGDEYVLNGHKIFIINGGKADLITVAASTDKELGLKGISLFVVEKDTPGFSVGQKENTMGLRAVDISELKFEDCKIPKENLIGKEGEGYNMINSAWNMNRIGIASQAVGILQACLDAAVEYANTRVQFGRTISKFQAIQWMIADMGVNVEAARLLLRKAAFLRDSDKDFATAASIAKLHASEMAMQAAINTIQIHGGIGYTKEYPVERYYRDAKATEIYGGTSEIQRSVVAKDLLEG